MYACIVLSARFAYISAISIIRLEAPGKRGPGWTIIHGDFKNANILFSKSGDVCAAVDFQYCGQSYGARDLAMLLVVGIDLRKY